MSRARAGGLAGLCVVIGLLVAWFAAPIWLAVAPGVAEAGDFSEGVLAVLSGAMDAPALFADWVAGGWKGHVPGLILWSIPAACVMAVVGAVAARPQSRAASGGPWGDEQVRHGHRALTKAFVFWREGKQADYGRVVGSTRHGYYIDTTSPHSVAVGGTGLGKTQLDVLQNVHMAMESGVNVIVSGKPELQELTADKAEELGYKIVTLSISGYPGASRYNPVSLVADYWEQGRDDLAVMAARQLAADIQPLEEGSGRYFSECSRSLINALVMIVATADIPRSRKNMGSVVRLFVEGTTGSDKDPSKRLKDHIRSLGPEHPAYTAAAAFLADGGKTNSGACTLTTARQTLEIYADRWFASLMSESDVEMREIVTEKTVVYLHIVTDSRNPYLAFLRIFLNQWWEVANREAEANGRLPRETALILDEAGNLGGKLDLLPKVMTLARSAGVRCHTWWQSLSQLNVYNDSGDGGAGVQTLLANCGCKVVLGAEGPDARRLSELCGDTTRRSAASSEATVGGGSSSMSEVRVPLVPAEAMSRRVPAKDGLLVIKSAGGQSRSDAAMVYETPVRFANKTPAGPFFGLGSECFESEKKSSYKARMTAEHGVAETRRADTWCPDWPEPEPERPSAAEEFRAALEQERLGRGAMRFD